MNVYFPELEERLGQMEKVLIAIMEGEKPRATENDWIYEQGARMFAGHFIAESPASFLTLPGDGDWELDHKGETSSHPVPATLIEENDNLGLLLHEAGIENFRTFGLSQDSFEDRKASAGSFVLTPGDFRALLDFVQNFKAKLAGDPAIKSKPIVLQNSFDAFWKPVIRHLGLDHNRAALKKIGVFMTEDMPGTAGALERALGGRKSDKPQMSKSPLTIPVGSIILVSTRNNKKIHEMQAILDGMGAAVRVLPFNTILRKPAEAREESKTYAGNNIEKIQTTIECVDQMGLENVRDILRDRGLDPAKTFICVDDRGLALRENLMTDPVFDDCRSFLNPYKEMPGAELAHVLKAMGISDMYGRLEHAIRNEEQRRKEAGIARPVDRTIVDYTNYVFCPIEPDAQGNRAIQGFWAESEDMITPDPSPSDGVLYSENYLIPKNDPDGRTKADIPEYIEKRSSMARAMRAAGRILGIDRHAESAARAFNSRAADNHKWVLGTQYTLRPRDSLLSAQMFGREQVRKGPFEFKKSNGDYDLLNLRKHWIKANDEGSKQHAVLSGLNNFQKFADDSNAFVLLPEKNSDELTILRNMFMFFSLVVGKQVFDPTIAGKPVVILNPGGDQTWAPFQKIYHHLHRHGLLGDKPEHVYRIKETSAEIRDHLKKRKERYIPENVVAVPYEERGEPVREGDGQFRVTVYCSATSTNASCCSQTSELGYKLAEGGFAVKYGGGTMGLMDKISRGFHRFRQDHPDSSVKNHISAIQCADTAQSEGLCEGDDFSCIHTNIYHRIEDLSDTDGEVVLWGGAGTVQEIAASALQRMTGSRGTKNRPLVIVNQEIGHGDHKAKVFGPVTDIFTETLCEKLNIHFVDTIEESMEIITRAREDRKMQPGPVSSPHGYSYISRAAG
jgi:predicted Rossmann-fold nucleotide-binding protein